MGLIPYQYLTFAGRSSEDFDCHISGSGTYNSPQRDIENIAVPGRNGDLHIDNGRFNNIEITYPAFITKHFEHNYAHLKTFLLSKRGYQRLEDTYHPDFYRRARFVGNITPVMSTLNKAGSFDLTFDCDPRRFFLSGEIVITLNADGNITNLSQFPALPLIRAYGTGSMTVNGITVQIQTADGYTDIDSELQEAYKGSTNCNNNIILTNGAFPELAPGTNVITFTGLTKLEIKPNWWTV